MADVPSTTDDSLEITATALSTPTMSSDLNTPSPTGEGDGEGTGANLRLDRRWAVAATLASALVAGVVLL